MTEQHTPGNLFSLIIPGKDKPTKIYGILLEEYYDMNRLNVKDGWWRVLLKSEIKFINVNSDFYKTERHIDEN